LGNLQPRKNLVTLLRAWKQIMNHPALGDMDLVITGKRAWLFEEILREATLGGDMSRRIRFTGYLPQEDLPALYSGAELFVYPSLFEGFGLPPIEAMACGTPVITGHHSAIREVCGNAVRYADITDPDALGKTILQLLENEAERLSLASLGKLRAENFTLGHLAGSTVRGWNEIARNESRTHTRRIS